ILTDSGGFQVFSLVYGGIADEIKGRRPTQQAQPGMVKVTEDAVIFKSYIDGSQHVFTPERSIEIQKGIGADIIPSFHDVPPFHAGYGYTARSLERTHRWAVRCLNYHQQTLELVNRPPTTDHRPLTPAALEAQPPTPNPQPPAPNPDQSLFGIVHGGVFP